MEHPPSALAAFLDMLWADGTRWSWSAHTLLPDMGRARRSRSLPG